MSARLHVIGGAGSPVAQPASPEMDEAVAEIVERTRAAQNLPPKIQDPTVLRKVATIARDHGATK